MYAVLLEDYMRPNNLEFDKEFMTRGIVSLMINAYGMFCVITRQFDWLLQSLTLSSITAAS